MIGIAFYRGRGIVPALIRGATWSEFCHVDLVDLGRAAAIGALFRTGVTERALPKDALLMTMDAPEDVLYWARGQLGKPYDYTGITGFLSRNRHWEKEDSWFCSEFVLAACRQAGVDLLRPEASASTITPQHLWLSPLIKPFEG